MGLLQEIATAALTAVTALLPIGASGHSLTLSALTGWPTLDATAVIAVFLGLLLAIAVYFWRDVVALAVGVGQLARGRPQAEAHLLSCLLVGSLPAVVAGLALAAARVTPLASLAVVGWSSLAFGVLLYLGDRVGVTVRRLPHMTARAALLIGAAQIAALSPGVGRTGMAVTLARIVGFERAEAARFSVLLSGPALVAAIALTALGSGGIDRIRITTGAVAAGAAAFAVGYAAIAATMAWVETRTFAPFAAYRIVGGAALLVWLQVH